MKFTVTEAPPDPLFGLAAKYKADTFGEKVDLGIGAYRDDEGKPWILRAVREAERQLQSDPSFNHEYLPITGLPEYTAGAARIVFGQDLSKKLADEGRLVSVQSVSGTGSLHMAASFLRKFAPVVGDIYVTDPTWANHKQIFQTKGFTVQTLPYWDAEAKGLKYEAFVSGIRSAPAGSVVILHTCAHNPTGVDPTKEQWQGIFAAIREAGVYPIFDTAYQGFASGNLAEDAWAIRNFIESAPADSPAEFIVCQSFAKNFGLYGERTGCFHIVSAPNVSAAAVKSQLAIITRSEISNPPAYGSKIVLTICQNPKLYSQWEADLQLMSSRIGEMRKQLRSKLEALDSSKSWAHITDQIGMFSFTGLSPKQVDRLISEFHVYLTQNGRISMAGINSKNIDYIAKAFHEVSK